MLRWLLFFFSLSFYFVVLQVEQRSSTVGLGNKSSAYGALAGESYKECVKKMMYARYQELSEKE